MFFDLPRLYQWNFQDPASPTMEGITALFFNIFFILLVILGAVSYLLHSIVRDGSITWMHANRNTMYRQKDFLKFNGTVHGTVLEIIWTIIPSLILFAVAIPSFALLYSMEEILTPQLTIKLVAHQWYWSYEYGNPGIEYDSYLINENRTGLSYGQCSELCGVNHGYMPICTFATKNHSSIPYA